MKYLPPECSAVLSGVWNVWSASIVSCCTYGIIGSIAVTSVHITVRWKIMMYVAGRAGKKNDAASFPGGTDPLGTARTNWNKLVVRF